MVSLLLHACFGPDHAARHAADADNVDDAGLLRNAGMIFFYSRSRSIPMIWKGIAGYEIALRSPSLPEKMRVGGWNLGHGLSNAHWTTTKSILVNCLLAIIVCYTGAKLLLVLHS